MTTQNKAQKIGAGAANVPASVIAAGAKEAMVALDAARDTIVALVSQADVDADAVLTSGAARAAQATSILTDLLHLTKTSP
jgi:hypothetical protein